MTVSDLSRSRLGLELAKWLATVQICWAKYMAYKLNFVLLVLAPVLVFFFIRYSLWSAIYGLDGVSQLQGYDFKGMLAYQVWVMIVGLLGMSFNNMNLAEDIRLGRISAYLIYPFGFWQYHSSSFIALELLQTLVSLLAISLFATCHWLEISSIWHLLNGFGFSLCVALFWFQLNFLIGILAFWMEETWVLRVMMVTITQFLSGAIFPLEIFPDVLRQALAYSPFPYLTYVPVKLFMGSYTGSVPTAYALVLLWFAVVLILSRWLWRQGLKAYTAAGM